MARLPISEKQQAEIGKLAAQGLTASEIAAQLGLSAPTVRKYWANGSAPANAPSVREVVKSDLAQKKLQGQLDEYKAKYEHAIDELEGHEKLVRAALEIKDVAPVAIKRKPSRGIKGEATAIAVASDWHCGAIVRPNTVNFLNEYNPDIFEERAHNFFRNLLTLINKERAAVNIHRLLLGAIGDFIENAIHPELLEEATLSPIEQMLLAQNTIAGGLDYLLKESDLAEIVVATCPGNHGRSTDKKRISTNYKNSYEQLMYWSLARHYKHEPRIKFQVSDSYVNYSEVYGKVIGWHHGDSTKYQGGVGGLIIPLRKFAYRINQQRRVDVLVNGHWHMQFIDSDIMSNGSLIGPTAYGMALGFPPERPQQIFRLLDADEGFTAYFPILVEKHVRQG